MEEPTLALADAQQAAAEVKNKARLLGFDLVGIASAEPSRYQQYLRRWLDDGCAGDMAYLGRKFAERTDPAVYVAGAESVVCLAVNYHVELAAPEGGQRGKVARYALGDDYHDWMTLRIRSLADWMRQAFPGITTRACVDTAPVMEKELSARAGLGWIGKNTCLISPEIGSWLFLGEIITTLALPADEAGSDHCGTCRRCIDACPTGAITAPYQLDARRCISYLTIEHPAELSDSESRMVGQWIYGCDVCQDVCPWNGRAPVAIAGEVQPRFAGGSVAVGEVLAWSPEDYARKLKGSAMKRVKLPVLQRNARAVGENLAGKQSVQTAAPGAAAPGYQG